MLLLTTTTERGGLKMLVRDHLNVWKDHLLTSAALVLIPFFFNKRARSGPGRPREALLVQPQQQQMKLCGRDVNDPIANQHMDIAITNFVHSNCLPFSLTRCPKFLKVIAEAKNVSTKYLPPN
jgi:hypothetical protein